MTTPTEEPFKAGETVYVTSSGYGRSTRKATIARVTKTQAIVQDGNREARFNRHTGRLVGGDVWARSRIDRPTPALDRVYAKEKADEARRRLAHVAAKGTPDEIRAAYASWDRSEQEARA